MNIDKLVGKTLSEAATIFELFTWWYPGRLAEESGIKLDRVKYICKLARGIPGSPYELLDKDDPSIEAILLKFINYLDEDEYQRLKSLLPKTSSGDKFDFVDLFAGIGGLRKPFSEIGGRCVLTCEWDLYAKKTYKANWKDGKEHKFISDIKNITQPSVNDTRLTGYDQLRYIDSNVPQHDVLLAGFPCQPFSIAGVSKKNALKRCHGFDCEDQGQLFFDICRILSVKQPPIAIGSASTISR